MLVLLRGMPGKGIAPQFENQKKPGRSVYLPGGVCLGLFSGLVAILRLGLPRRAARQACQPG